MNEHQRRRVILRMIRGGKDSGVDRKNIAIIILLLAFLTVTIFCIILFKYLQDAEDNISRLEHFIVTDIEKQRELDSYRGYLPVRIYDNMIQYTDGVLTVPGRITHTRNRPIGDITITVFILGNKENPTFWQSFTISSADGTPLLKGQRRPFKVRIHNPPFQSKSIQVAITGIEFVE